MMHWGWTQHIGLTPESLLALEDVSCKSQKVEVERAAVREFFASIVNEVHEEINVPEADLSPPLLLGVVLQTEALTPSFCTTSSCMALFGVGDLTNGWLVVVSVRSVLPAHAEISGGGDGDVPSWTKGPIRVVVAGAHRHEAAAGGGQRRVHVRRCFAEFTFAIDGCITAHSVSGPALRFVSGIA